MDWVIGPEVQEFGETLDLSARFMLLRLIIATAHSESDDDSLWFDDFDGWRVGVDGRFMVYLFHELPGLWAAVHARFLNTYFDAAWDDQG